jgi:hypothetical protein
MEVSKDKYFSNQHEFGMARPRVVQTAPLLKVSLMLISALVLHYDRSWVANLQPKPSFFSPQWWVG